MNFGMITHLLLKHSQPLTQHKPLLLVPLQQQFARLTPHEVMSVQYSQKIKPACPVTRPSTLDQTLSLLEIHGCQDKYPFITAVSN
jgi:hypothetical protein